MPRIDQSTAERIADIVTPTLDVIAVAMDHMNTLELSMILAAAVENYQRRTSAVETREMLRRVISAVE